MKTRAESVQKLQELMDLPEDVYKAKAEKHHFGYIELRVFLDWLYEGIPQSESELLNPTYPKNPESYI